jgi:hypothetical protein
MENVNDKKATAKPESERDSDKWDAYDEYDCRLNEPKQTAEYIANTTPPGVKEAIARRQAARAAIAAKTDQEKS